MKILLKIMVICLLVSSCEDTESITFDPNGGVVGIGFGVSTLDFSVPEGGITVSVPVTATNTSSQARTFAVAVDTELSTVTSADYSLGAVTIPADSYEGSVDVTINYDGLEDFVLNELVLKLDVPNSAFPPIALTFLREFDITTFACADLTLTLDEDAYADERDWDITNSSGTVVAQCSDYASCPGGAPSGSIPATIYNFTIPTLPAGDYTFTIYDSYGDGQTDGNIVGSYNLYCSAQNVVSYASGGGNFGDSESTDFTIVE